MKIENIINETTAGATASGSVAAVAKPMGETQKRPKTGPKVAGLEPADKVMFGKAKKKGPYTNSISESAIKEDELSEEDMFLMRGEKPKVFGFIPKGQSRVDHEVEMARSDLVQAMKNAKTVYELIKDRSEDEGLEGWVQEKIIKAADYLNTIAEYLEGKKVQEMQGGVVAAGGVGEGIEGPDNPVANAIIRRILMQRTDLLAKHGPEKVGQAVDDVADFVGDVDEIGSSDVSGWVKQVEQSLSSMTESMGSGSVGYDNAKAIAYAVKDGTSADVKLGDDTVTLEYPEARFVYGIYKQAVKDHRIEDMIKVLEDPVKFHKMMKKMGDMLYRDRSKEMAQAAAQRIGQPGMMEGAKVDRMVQHIKKSEMKAGKSADKAEDIAWATANKRGYLDNKNKKKKD